jgi:FMN phosphatase YigB (HAD superfamily)
MKGIKAIICDVYRTILDVGEAPEDAEERWSRLFRSALGRDPELSLEQLSGRCRDIISEDHREAQRRGILYPEVDWRSVMTRALPGLEVLPGQNVDAFLFDHAQLLRALRIMTGCAAVLRKCQEQGILLGIASNAQAYTVKELELALSKAGLHPSIFQSDLTFWSFEHGFSKPNPYVFEILRARLRSRSLLVSQALMIGDREDNDILPARNTGWKTWRLSDLGNGSDAGNWKTLARALFQSDTTFLEGGPIEPP